MSLSPFTQLDDLLSAWNAHQDLRNSGGSVPDLAISRWSLDDRRAALR